MTDRNLGHLKPAKAFFGQALAQPRLILCLVTVAAAGWVIVLLSSTHVLHVLMPPGHGWHAGDFVAAALMWGAMVLAMMLPSAVPMILTYAQIADTAARKGEHIVSPFVLAAGYVLVWLGFAVLAALLQGAMTHTGVLDAASASTHGLLSGLLFAGAGLYQFSALKHACLHQCQHPLPFFFANWTTRRSGIFRLGLRQGVYCLGCCWALMLLMFAVGVMNIAWLLILTLVIIGEKLTTRLARPVGMLLIVIGVALAATAGFTR
jgi:predicted metal-binding membrane protein